MERVIKEKNRSTRDVLIIFICLYLINKRKAVKNINVKRILIIDDVLERFKALNELLNVKVLEMAEKFF